MIKEIIKYIVDVLVLPVINFFLNKHDDKIDIGIEYLEQIIQLLANFRDTVKDKNISPEELDKIYNQITEIKDKINL